MVVIKKIVIDFYITAGGRTRRVMRPGQNRGPCQSQSRDQGKSSLEQVPPSASIEQHPDPRWASEAIRQSPEATGRSPHLF